MLDNLDQLQRLAFDLLTHIWIENISGRSVAEKNDHLLP